MTAFWCESAQLEDRVRKGVRIEVEDGRITAVSSRARQQPDDVRLDGVVLPGLANGHSHAFHRMLRGCTHGDGGTFWTWREAMYAVAAVLTPELYLALARAVFAEMLHAGFTVVADFHYLHHRPTGRPYTDRGVMGEALVQAAREVGIRFTLLDTLYLTGGLLPDGHRSPDPVQKRFADRTVDAWAARLDAMPDTETARVGGAVHSVRAVPHTHLPAVAGLIGERPLHAHVSEQLAENAVCQAYYGRTPTELFDDAGLLSPRFTAVHATHLSDHDIALLGRSRATACFCPTTERDLGDGIGPARALAEAGAALSLGSDQHAVVDPFEEMRGLEMHERLVTSERGRFTPRHLVHIASVAGYASLGWPDGGRIAPGALADLVAVRADSRRTAGSSPDQIIHSATSADVTDVVVHGRHLVRGGDHHRLGDVDHLVAEAVDLVRHALA